VSLSGATLEAEIPLEGLGGGTLNSDFQNIAFRTEAQRHARLSLLLLTGAIGCNELCPRIRGFYVLSNQFKWRAICGTDR